MFTLYRIRQLSHSSLLKNSFVYVVTDGVNKAIPFVLLPIISRYLSPSEYGIVTNYNVFISVLGALVYLCTGGVVPVMYFKLPKDEMKRLCFQYISCKYSLCFNMSNCCIIVFW